MSLKFKLETLMARHKYKIPIANLTKIYGRIKILGGKN